jgi:tetratricopeptide (TPR) repeat protein
MVERLADYPFLLFATTRPWMRENRPDLLADRDVVWLEPRGLSGRDVAGLVRHLSGREPPDRLVRALRERTDGNPLFIEQIVLELVEQGTLSDSIEGRPLPVTVEAAIQSRLDHLPHLEKTLCKRAAVLGRPFSAEEVEALGTGDARSLLDSLRSRGFIAARSASRVGKDREYRFRNALVAEVAYNMLADEVRADLHRRAAVALARSTDATDEEIALHHERGGEPEQAATRYAAATRTAARTCDSETVLRCSERALELGVADEDRYELHMARADALHFRGRFEEQGTEIDGALKYAPDEVGRARALTERIIGLWRAGKVDDALEVAEQAAARAEETGDPEVLALALGRRAVLLVHRGELTEAGRMLSRATETAAKTRPWIRALMSAYRAQLVGVEGNLAARRASYGEALGQFDAVGDIRRAALNEINLADTLNRFGSYEQAESALRNAAAKCHRAAHRVGEGYAMANLGYSLLMLGRVEQALRTLEQAAAIARSTETAHLRVMVAVYKARARLDDPEATTQVVAEAKEAALETERIRLPGYRIVALTVAARAYLSAGATDKALDKAREAFEQLEELGSVEEDEAEVFLTYADSLEAAGEREQAEHIRQRGRTRLQELASEIEDERWRQQFLTQVPAHRKLLETGST